MNKSEIRPNTHVSYVKNSNVNDIEFLELQNQFGNNQSALQYQIYGLSMLKLKKYEYFFKFAFLLSGDIQLNAGPSDNLCFVCKQRVDKRDFSCIKCDLRVFM